MLEFQDSFFEQEIRDDFYIDESIKAGWAAGLEVLQKIAEVCDRYDITWYAAYGTLLGAIRHEGYIPWDDDLDIWVKREGYNKLAQILPRELPSGYHVRSPLTAEGYKQFHMIVQNSDHIHMEREWLEQYHGSPFSAGVDIFPLDYLPQREEEQVTQRELVAIATRSAQVACYLDDGEYKNPEDPTEEKNAYIEEIWDGIHYLEANCGIKVRQQLVMEEKWGELASEFGKWANYLSMMYGEEESEYLANFIDYVRWPEKKFPREWFAEAYSAKFENFMLPVPCGYEQLLHKIYGDYKVVRKHTGTHDYPYYLSQLEELQRLARQNAQATGTAVEEEIAPADWQKLFTRTDGGKKKIVLYANDISDFITYGDEALDKLESVLQTFYEAREHILLWWRPQRQMLRALALADRSAGSGLAPRYKAVMEQYKTAGWGVYDESFDRQRALEICDAYYGVKDNMAMKFRDRGKPVMVADPKIIY